MSYQRKCRYFSMEYVGNPGAVPACNRDAVLEAFDCLNCKDNPDNKKLTNADLYRSYSDEKMAELFSQIETEGKAYGPRGKAQWLNWLRQEAT